MPELSPEERQRIYEEEKVRKEAQDRLKETEDKLKKDAQQKKTQQGCLGCLGFVVLLFLIIYLFWPSGGPVPPARDFVNRGEEGQLVSGADSIAVAVNSEALDALSKAASAKDQIGYQAVFRSGRAFIVDANTRVLVLDPGILSTEIRILQGPNTGKSGLVPAEWVKKR